MDEKKLLKHRISGLRASKRSSKKDSRCSDINIVNGRGSDDKKFESNPKKITNRWSIWKLTFIIFGIRLLNSLTIRTFFQADEYYQALEPAYHFIFGTGYLTWEWKKQLRSSIHPMIYALGYEVSKLISNRDATQIIPKIISASIATLGEVHIYIFAREYTRNETIARVALGVSLSNAFNWYVITRSFSNSFEMSLTAVALAHWPWGSTIDYRRLRWAITFAFVACVVRPTNALIWIILGPHLLCRIYAKDNNPKEIWGIISLLSQQLAIVLIASSTCDRIFYGFWTFPLYNFIDFNVLRGLSVFYGTAPFHFYLFQAIPIILTAYLPWFLWGIYKAFKEHNIVAVTLATTIFGFSLIQHKEFRFIYPLQPFLVTITAGSLVSLYKKSVKIHLRILLPIALLANMFLAFYFTRIHERGVIDVITDLSNDPSVTSIGILAPCHSTPWSAHINKTPLSERSWFISCEPPLHMKRSELELLLPVYKDESDLFYENVQDFLDKRLRKSRKTLNSADPDITREKNTQYLHEWPSHLVFFEPLKDELDVIMVKHGYIFFRKYFNSQFHWDHRRNGYVYVYIRQETARS